MPTIAAVVVISVFALLFAAMAIAPALIESAASPRPRPRFELVETPRTMDGDDEQPRAA